MNHMRCAARAWSIIACLLLGGGCFSEPLQPSLPPGPAQANVNLPPRQALAEVKRIVEAEPLKLGIEEESNGTVVTGWQRHRGNFHIGRHWQERTRYRISVIPDWNEPAGRARIDVSAQTEERAAEGQRWTPAPHIHRSERAQAVLDQILAQLPRGGQAAP